MPTESQSNDRVQLSRLSRRPVALAAMLAAITGSTMLAAQVAWMRLAQVEVGSGLAAGAISLAATMAGMAIGARRAGRALRRRSPGGMAVWQQAFTTLSLLVSPLLIGWAGAAAAGFARTRHYDFELANLTTALAVGLVLVLLNLPFGMLLPTVVEFDARFGDRPLARRGGVFYALQSGGAVMGAVAFGLALPAFVGFGLTLIVLAAIHLLMMVQCMLAKRAHPSLALPAAPPAEGLPGIGRTRGVAWLAFWLGVAGLAAELVWLRGLGFYLRSNIHTYAMTAAAFVGSLALGSLVGAHFAPNRRRPGQDLAALLLLAAMAVSGSTWVMERLPAMMGNSPSDTAGGLLLYLGQTFLLAELVIGPAVILMGLAFPMLLRLADQPARAELKMPGGHVGYTGRLIARIVGANLIGSVVGVAVAFGLLLGSLGERRSLLAIAVGYMIAALWAEVIDPAIGWHRHRSRAAGPDADHLDDAQTRHDRLREAAQKRIPWLNIALFFAAAGATVLQANTRPMFAGAYLRTPDGRVLDEQADRDTVAVRVTESRDAIVATRRHTDTGTLELLVNQDIQGDDSVLGLRVQRLQGVLPLVLAPNDRPARALVVGLGTGCSVAPLVQAGVSRITVAELAEPVIAAAKSEFAHANGNLRDYTKVEFTSPSAPAGPTTAPTSAADTSRDTQVRILHADGRSVLRLEPGGWDIILVDIIYPTAPGAGGLFSEQFYRLARERLAPNGIFVHWLPLWQMGPHETASVVGAFNRAFPAGGGQFQSLGYAAVPSPGRPMLALVAMGRPGLAPTRYPRENKRLDDAPLGADFLRLRLARLQPMLDRNVGRLRPATRELDLGSADQIAAGLVDVADWTVDLTEHGFDPPATDLFPVTELQATLANETTAGHDNITGLLANGYSDPKMADPDIEMATGTDRARLAVRLTSRRTLAEAMRLPNDPANQKTFYDLLATAVQADPENPWASYWHQLLNYEQSLDLIERRVRSHELALEKAIDDLTRLDERHPYELRALRLKAEYRHELGQLPQAIGALDDLLARAPGAADVWFTKARWFTEHANAEREAGRVDAAREAAQEARGALLRVRQIRSALPSSYRSVQEKITPHLTNATSQPAK